MTITKSQGALAVARELEEIRAILVEQAPSLGDGGLTEQRVIGLMFGYARERLAKAPRCGNCGQQIGPHTSCISHDDDGEVVCSTFCLDQHELLGCPLAISDRYRDAEWQAQNAAPHGGKPS